MSRFSLYSRAGTYTISESSNGDLLHYSDMAQLHPPYVIEATASAVKECVNDPKRFVFQINLKWSDYSTSTSYRTYSEFFDFQCDLLAEFPKEAGAQRGQERTLPYLPGKKLFQRSSRKLAESRLLELDAYVKNLISMPETVSQCERTCRFFRSNWQEDRLRSERVSSQDCVRYTVKKQNSTDMLLPGGLVEPSTPNTEDGGSFSEENDRLSFT